MAVGKPNFNLNSFGIKYLSKDEVQELLNKAPPMDMRSSYERHRDNEKERESGVSNIKDEDLTTAKLNTSLSRPSVNTGTGASISSGASAPRRARNAAQPAVQAVKPAVKPAEVKPKADKDTKSIFNAEQDPKTLSFDQRKLLEDANEARPKNPKPDIFTGITPEKRRDYPTQGVIANSANVRSGEEGGKTEDITEVPDPRKRGGDKQELTNLGRTIPKGYKAPKGEKAERKRLSSIKPDEKKEKEVKEKETRETKDIPKKMGSRMVGNAPPEVKDTTNQVHSGKKVTVGVGEKAKEVFDKKEGVGAVHEETSKPKTVVAKPDKELNSITSSENNRLGDHRNEMDKFLKGATDAQRREYLNIKEREDGREDHDAQRAYARNITGKQSKTQEKVTQTKEEKESERKLEHADRMVDMKERDKRIKQEAWKEDEEFHKKIEEDEKTWQGKPDGKKEDKKFYGTGEKEGKTSTRVTPTKEKPVTTEDNPQSSKAPEEETEPNKITTDNIDNKLNAIATKLAQIKDPKKREEKRAELSGKNESDKSKKEIAAAKKRVEAAKKKIAAAKTKKETAKKKKVIPKEGQLTPAQVKAYKKERESKKDVVAKSNDIIMDTIIMKLDLMKEGALYTQYRQGNMKRRVGQRGGRSDYQHEQRSGSLARNEPQTREGQADDSTQPRVQLGHSAYTPTHEVENPDIKSPRSAGENTSIYEYPLDQHTPNKLHGTIPKGGKAPDNVGDDKPQKPKEIKIGEPEEIKEVSGLIPKGGKAPRGMKVKKSAEETIFKAISLKLDLSKDL